MVTGDTVGAKSLDKGKKITYLQSGNLCSTPFSTGGRSCRSIPRSLSKATCVPKGLSLMSGRLRRFEALLALHDQRDARGVRYALVTVLVFMVLAKLAGEDWLRGIAQWVTERKVGLAEFFGLAKPQAPCYTTYARILGRGVVTNEFEQVVHEFFAALPGAGHTVEIALDGKTLRGTIPLGASRGVHLLAAYFPGECLVFMQVEVDSRENKIVAAPRVLKGLDLQGKIITGDAMLTQRKLSVQIV